MGRRRQHTKQDVEIAKNYLNKEEISTLELLVNQYLDFAELQARQHKIMYMGNWKAKLDAFLDLNDQDILSNAGRISVKWPENWRMLNMMCIQKNDIKLKQTKSMKSCEKQ